MGWDGMGWDGMFIIGQRSSKSNFGANSKNLLYFSLILYYCHGLKFSEKGGSLIRGGRCGCAKLLTLMLQTCRGQEQCFQMDRLRARSSCYHAQAPLDFTELWLYLFWSMFRTLGGEGWHIFLQDECMMLVAFVVIVSKIKTSKTRRKTIRKNVVKTRQLKRTQRVQRSRCHCAILDNSPPVRFSACPLVVIWANLF